ncbi:hypothetical protein P691DRAFT_230845 [Macrolepiota fuliginosa MF-IS2]|uniref:Nephrocystin 3-like N-terminal domain-containing protein n=1 Tax=Macrolepiota fuliginosa MF-IS2 TaxID=1400762 RepID=A0A9P6C1U1_9AGAR|nr:hypothetical protein P691DRAFT_230845 [Macrolepiota fuliginosa MF-IS2]
MSLVQRPAGESTTKVFLELAIHRFKRSGPNIRNRAATVTARVFLTRLCQIDIAVSTRMGVSLPCSRTEMPFLETFKKLISRSPKSQKQNEEQPQAPNPGQLAFRVTLVQPATHVPTAINNDQHAYPGNDVSNISVVSVQQPPAGVSNTAAGSNNRATHPDDVILPEVPIVSTSSSVLANAHHFTIGQLTAISQNIHSGTTVLQQLGEKGKLAAMHDSSVRAYPPRCHPGTRETLRSRIVKWGMGGGSDERMLWALGPPAVGKSAVAQTIAEEFEGNGRLGASFFFSRPNNLDDPDWVIPTLAYQLATKHPQYKHIITQRLADDPSILEKNRQTQFRKLIIEPFCILMAEHPHTVREPLLIILDGLDECKDKQAQCEFIELISTHVREVKEFRSGG